MAKLVWDNTGEHFYETGISQGVLFVAAKNAETGATAWAKGVPWNGLISVSESPEGADEESFYADNIKYLSLRGVEDFGGSISAYQSPIEFDQCDGTVSIGGEGNTGITIGQQTRTAFCLAYKTQIGNDVDGSEHAYTLHIIYNATASPSEREYQTINDSPEPAELSWDFSTSPIPVTGHKPTSIVKIDSRYVSSSVLTAIENSLFGSAEADSKLLLPDEIVALIPAG